MCWVVEIRIFLFVFLGRVVVGGVEMGDLSLSMVKYDIKVYFLISMYFMLIFCFLLFMSFFYFCYRGFNLCIFFEYWFLEVFDNFDKLFMLVGRGFMYKVKVNLMEKIVWCMFEYCRKYLCFFLSVWVWFLVVYWYCLCLFFVGRRC